MNWRRVWTALLVGILVGLANVLVGLAVAILALVWMHRRAKDESDD